MSTLVNILTFTLYISCDFYLWSIIRCYLFKEHLRFSFFKTISYFTAMVFVAGTGLYCFYEPDISFTRLTIYRFIFFILFSFITLTVTNDGVVKQIFVFLLLYPLSFTGMAISWRLEQTILADYYAQNPVLMEGLVRLSFTIIVAAPVYYILKKSIYPILRYSSNVAWRYLIPIPAVFCIITTIVSRIFLGPENIRFILIIRLVVIVGSLTISLAVAEFAKTNHNKILNENKEKNMERLIALQERQYEEINDHINEVRRINHDVRHHARAILALAEEGNNDAIKEYLANYEKYFPSGLGLLFCENIMLNAILEYYYKLAKEKNIAFEITADTPEKSGILSSDLSALVGNLLENAIEAQDYVTKENRSVRIKIDTIENKMYFICENPYVGNINIKNDNYLSSKRNYKSAGIGLESIMGIVEKYNGEIKIDTDNNIFKSMIMLEYQ